MDADILRPPEDRSRNAVGADGPLRAAGKLERGRVPAECGRRRLSRHHRRGHRPREEPPRMRHGPGRPRARWNAGFTAREVVAPVEAHDKGQDGAFDWERTVTVVAAPDLERTPATRKWRVYQIDVKVRW